MATQAEVRLRALIKLGVGSRTETPVSYLTNDMSNAYTEVYLRLQELDIAYWGQTSDVPDEVANEVAVLMAWRRVNDYGVGNDRYTRLAQEYVAAEPRIREVSVSAYRSTDDPEDF
jgi:hypothetical protein